MSDDDLRTEVAELRARVDLLERAGVAADDDTTWWLLDELKGRTGGEYEDGETAGSVAFGGRTTTPGAGQTLWQVEQPVPVVFGADVDAAAEVLAALGHPQRLRILRALLLGARTLAELQELPGAGTSGQVTHHLRQLRAAGWVTVRRRNDYGVPAERVVPALVIIAAALGPQLGE